VSLTRLFVYGTLRRDFQNHRELAGAKYLGSLLTEARCALVQREGYPALIRGDDAVSGELYAVDAALLGRLDVFEGAGYVRRPVKLADGSSADAYWAADGTE
jgi:gamma-glutamylaminecyclotransferase